jgi:hypothetical protein
MLTDNSKFYLYNKIKHDIVLEEYLIQEKNFKNRQLIAKFQTSDHCLKNLQHPNQILERHLMPKYTMCIYNYLRWRNMLYIEDIIIYPVNKDFALLVIS